MRSWLILRAIGCKVVKVFGYIRAALYSVPGKALSSAIMFISSFFAVFSALPPLVTYITDLRSKSVMVMLLSVVFVILAAGWPVGIIYTATVVFSVVVLGELLRAKIKFGNILLLASIIVVGTYVVFTATYCLAYSVNIIDLLASRIDALLTIMSSTYPDALKQALVDSGMTQKELALTLAIKTPATISVIMIIFLFVNLLIVARFDFNAASYLIKPSLMKVKVPDYFIFPAIIFGALYVYTNYTSYAHTSLLEAVSLFLFKSTMMAYLFHGIILVQLFLSARMRDGFLKMILFSIVVIFAYVFVIALGFFDTWFNFRKYLNTKKEGETL